ncbi:MAG: DsbA family protein, partial [Acidimicrobiia bacterium]|nr:DsbA family protein [Acidimicrobiia bacterium]
GPAAEPMTDAMERFLSHHWREVAGRSGQPFDTAVLHRRDWIYDTETPCRAVVAARRVDPDLAWPAFERLQRAFYAEGLIVSRADVYPEVLEGTGIDLDAFTAAFQAEDAVRKTWDDFGLARRWGVTGFPTTILRAGDTGRILAAGYTSAERLDRLIGSLIDSEDATVD